MNKSSWWKKYGFSIFLLASIIAIFTYYRNLTQDLSSQIYTADQQAFLSYASQRALFQNPIVTNNYRYSAKDVESGVLPVNSADAIVPAHFTVWENKVQATLEARYEEKDEVSITAYDLEFTSEYHFQYASTEVTTTLELIFPFPANLETLHNVTFLVDGEEPENTQFTPQQIRWVTELMPGQEHDIYVHYRADGADRFQIGLNQDRRTDQLDVSITIKGLSGSQIPNRSLPATEIKPNETDGEVLSWQYDRLLANRDIELTLPRQLSFAQRVNALQNDFRYLGYLAPFLVLLFILSFASLMWLKQVKLPLPTYLLGGLGLAFFYPLLTYSSGLIGAIPASIVSVIVVSGLLILFFSPLIKQHWSMPGFLWLLFIFLVLFSLGTLTPFRGLLQTLGGVLLVGTVMLAYAKRPATEDHPAQLAPAPLSSELAESLEEEHPGPDPLSPAQLHCPQCGRGLDTDFDFCPGCGFDAWQIQRCATCNHKQLLPQTGEGFHCLHCGSELTSVDAPE